MQTYVGVWFYPVSKMFLEYLNDIRFAKKTQNLDEVTDFYIRASIVFLSTPSPLKLLLIGK